VGQTAPKVGEVLRVSKMLIITKDNNYKVDVDYGNPLNPNGTTVGHLDMNTCDYTVEVGHVNPRKPTGDCVNQYDIDS
jgi:hypothetical protein